MPRRPQRRTAEKPVGLRCRSCLTPPPHFVACMQGRVLEFSEKPKGDALKAMAVDTRVLGLSAEEAKKRPYIASMGAARGKRLRSPA